MKTERVYLEHQLIFLLMGGFLLVDALVGAVEIYLGLHVKVSLVYKTPVLLLVLLVIGLRDAKAAMWLLIAVFLFLLGPTVALVKQSDLTAYFYDFTLVLKILSPLLYLQYFSLVGKESPGFIQRFGPVILWVNFMVLLVNILLGLLGFGYASYSSDEGNIGVNGFFGAGNELGAVFIVLSAFFLAHSYAKGRFYYFGAAFAVIALGLVISTKTSILSALLLATLTPVFLQGRKYFTLTLSKVIWLLGILIITSIAIYLAIEKLQEAGLWKRIAWLYNEYGIARVIWSSRDQYAQELFQLFSGASWYQWLVGLSSSGISHAWLPVKLRAEIDPVDVVVMFGFIGLTIALIVNLKLVFTAIKCHQTQKSLLSSASLLSLFLLECLAFTSGHIWLSGMLGPFLGLLIGLAVANSREATPLSAAQTFPRNTDQANLASTV